MTQKDLILSVLTRLNPYRDMADGLISLIESEFATDELIKSILKFITQKIINVKGIIHLDKEKSALSAIQFHEQAEKEKDIREIEDLLATIG